MSRFTCGQIVFLNDSTKGTIKDIVVNSGVATLTVEVPNEDDRILSEGDIQCAYYQDRRLAQRMQYMLSHWGTMTPKCLTLLKRQLLFKRQKDGFVGVTDLAAGQHWCYPVFLKKSNSDDTLFRYGVIGGGLEKVDRDSVYNCYGPDGWLEVQGESMDGNSHRRVIQAAAIQGAIVGWSIRPHGNSLYLAFTSGLNLLQVFCPRANAPKSPREARDLPLDWTLVIANSLNRTAHLDLELVTKKSDRYSCQIPNYKREFTTSSGKSSKTVQVYADDILYKMNESGVISDEEMQSFREQDFALRYGYLYV